MFFLDLDDEHVLAIGFPMARAFPENAVHDLRGLDLLVAGGAETAAHVVLELAVDGPAVRMPENHAGRFFLEVEKLHFAAELAVVAFRRLFQHREMSLQILPVLEADTVNALELFLGVIAAPIGARDAHQFEGVGGQLAGMLEMRAAAEILPVAMPVHPQGLVTSGSPRSARP